MLASSVVAQTAIDQLDFHIGARFQPHIIDKSVKNVVPFVDDWAKAAVQIVDANASSCIQGRIKGWF